MMREEGEEETTDEPKRVNPFSWTARKARRVQLALRTSITSSVAKRAVFDENDETDEVITLSSAVPGLTCPLEENANIDQAMLGLYCLPDHSKQSTLFPATPLVDSVSSQHSIYDMSSLLSLPNQLSSSSYIPQEDWDPILDAGFRDAAEEEKSQQLLHIMSDYCQSSDDWEALLARQHKTVYDEESDNSSSSSSSISNHYNTDQNSHDYDDDEFGDFQSADVPVTNDAVPNTPASAMRPKVELLETPPPTIRHPNHNYHEDEQSSLGSGTTFETINTVGLIRRADELLSGGSSLDDHDLVSSLSNDISTPALLAQTNEILDRAAREMESINQPVGATTAASSDSDSDATPTTKSRPSLSNTTPSRRQLSRDFAMSSHKVSMDLPVSDLTQIEERWTRRRQLELQTPAAIDDMTGDEMKTLAEILSNLPELYLLSLDKIDDSPVEANAATMRVLNSVPWGCVHLDDQDYEHAPAENDFSIWDDFIADQLSQLDTSLQDVQQIMAASVNPQKLESANNLVHSCEQNLRLARIYWDRSTQALNAAVATDPDGSFNGSGILGNVHLLDLWQQKEDFSSLRDLLDRLENVTAQETEIIRRIDAFDATHSRAQDEYKEVVKLGKMLRAEVDGDLASLNCLSELRDNRLTSILEERFWQRLKYLSRQCAVQVCRERSAPSTEYDSLLKAAFGLFEASNSQEGDAAENRGTAFSNFDNETGWSKNLVEAMLYEAERCFACALLEPADAEDSAFVKDLKTLEHEIGKDWGDTAKLKTLTHNLVTIRFDFERSLGYLPRVMVRLCEGLLNILRAHIVFGQFHMSALESITANVGQDTQKPEVIRSIVRALKDSQVLLWEKCEAILSHALKEYHNFSSKVVLFTTEKQGTEDSVWQKELQGLHSVYCTLNCFLYYKSAFFGNDLARVGTGGGDQSLFLHTLQEIASDHLRHVHVEAMTSMGRLLSRETWHLTNFDDPEQSEKKVDSTSMTFSSRELISSSLTNTVRRYKYLSTFYSLTPDDNADHLHGSHNRNDYLLHPRKSVALNFTASDSPFCESDFDRAVIDSVYESIDVAVKATGDQSIRVIPQSIHGLLEWVARLMLVSVKVPSVIEKVCEALENIFDLYVTTVFRLCAGSRRNERIVLGEDVSTADSNFSSLSPMPLARKGASSPPMRRPSGRPPSAPARASVTISPTLDIEICAPMPKDMPEIKDARVFIDRAQQELLGNVNLNRVDSWIGSSSLQNDPEEYACAVAKSVERREAAAWSFLTVACIADTVLTHMEMHLSDESTSLSFVLKRFRGYVKQLSESVNVLCRKASEVSCTRALAPSGYVKDIVSVGGGWEECKLHEQPNEYVDALCERVCLIWGFVAASGKLPQYLVTQVWARLQTAAYMTLIEGFSRVIYCSTEGRALMALDLASLSSCLRRDAVLQRLESFDLPFTPPYVSPRYGKQYVDLYVKVYYYPQEDVLGWISENWQQYRMNHMFSLLSSSGYAGRKSQSGDIFERVKNLYDSQN